MRILLFYITVVYLCLFIASDINLIYIPYVFLYDCCANKEINYNAIARVSYLLGGCPLSGKSSMCMMCLKYRIILLIVIKNLWVILLTYFLLTAPLIPPAGLLAT